MAEVLLLVEIHCYSGGYEGRVDSLLSCTREPESAILYY